MVAVAWGKLLLNLNNAINALSGLTILEELHQRDYRRVMAAAMDETMELLKIAGIEPVATGPIPPRLLPHAIGAPDRSEEHTSELQSLMRSSYAVFCLKKKNIVIRTRQLQQYILKYHVL